jgi:hypothetical protein
MTQTWACTVAAMCFGESDPFFWLFVRTAIGSSYVAARITPTRMNRITSDSAICLSMIPRYAVFPICP